MGQLLKNHKDLPSTSSQALLEAGQLEALLGLSSEAEASLGKDAQTQLRVAKLVKQFTLPPESREATALFDKPHLLPDDVSTIAVQLAEITAAATSKSPWHDADQLLKMSKSLQGTLQKSADEATGALATRKAKAMDTDGAKPVLERMANKEDQLPDEVKAAVEGLDFVYCWVMLGDISDLRRNQPKTARCSATVRLYFPYGPHGLLVFLCYCVIILVLSVLLLLYYYCILYCYGVNSTVHELPPAGMGEFVAEEALASSFVDWEKDLSPFPGFEACMMTLKAVLNDFPSQKQTGQLLWSCMAADLLFKDEADEALLTKETSSFTHAEKKRLGAWWSDANRIR